MLLEQPLRFTVALQAAFKPDAQQLPVDLDVNRVWVDAGRAALRT